MLRTLNSSAARTVAEVAAFLLILIAALHGYWAFGGDWMLKTVSGGATKVTSSGFQAFAGVIAGLALLAAVEVLSLAGAMGSRLRRIASTKLVWAMVVVLAFGGIARTASAPVLGLSAIVLAVLFAVVAYASGEHASHRIGTTH